MIERLLRNLTSTGWRRGRAGSRVWMVVGVAAAGARLLRSVARDKEEVLYRTRVKPGDTFEITAREPVSSRKAKKK